ncbi:MAG: acyl-CoA dehydrogenase family protein [Kofleriaceae bacterium]
MSTLLDRARAIATDLAIHRTAHDREKQLARPVVAALRESELLSVLTPTELGGHATAPADYVDILEALAAGDSATAWCVMTCSTSTLLAPYLSRATAEAVWSRTPQPFIAGIFAPMGKLADGVLAGRWSYASGCRHADVFFVGALAERRHVVCLLDRDAVRIADNWDTIGLAGTGSHDLVIESAAIAADYVTSVFDRAPWSASPLYRVPLFGLLSLGIAGCALGIARSALAHATAKLDEKLPSAAFATIGELHATLSSARAYLRTVASDAYARASELDTTTTAAIDARTRGELRLASTFVAQRCADVVRGAFHLGGGASARSGSAAGSALRDIEMVLTHRMIADRVVPAATRAVFGVGTPSPDL